MVFPLLVGFCEQCGPGTPALVDVVGMTVGPAEAFPVEENCTMAPLSGEFDHLLEILG